jgi:hypothetical protein
MDHSPYWIETVSDSLHPQVMLCSRYVKFHKSLTSSKKPSVRFLSKLKEQDLRTVFGRTMFRIQNECEVLSLDDLSPSLVKKKLKYMDIPPCEHWRSIPLKELLLTRRNLVDIGNIEKADIELMIEYLCTE